MSYRRNVQNDATPVNGIGPRFAHRLHAPPSPGYRILLACQNAAMAERRELESEQVEAGVFEDATRRRSRQSLLVVLILVVAGLFDTLSGGNPVDSSLLVAVGVLLAVFPDGPSPREAQGIQVRLGAVATAFSLALAFAIVVGGFERQTWPITIGVLGPGIAALILAWRGTRRRDAGPRLEPRLVLPWIVLFVTLGLFELTNLLLQPGLTIDSFDHPTLSVLSDSLLTGHVGRSAGLFVWLLMGAYLLDR